MKIALLTNGIYPHVIGGMQKHSFYLAKYLARYGVHVDVYHAVPSDRKVQSDHDSLLTGEESRNIRFIEVERVKRMNFPGHYIRESYLNSSLFFDILRDQEPVDFIYAQGFAGWRTAVERHNGVNLPPIGINMHGLEMYQKSASVRAKLEHYMFRPFVRANLKRADIAFALGGGLGRILESLGIDASRIVESPNGISETWLSTDIPDRSDPLSFVFLGRYERRKGIEELHRAIRQLENNHRFEFHFIGPIPENLQLKNSNVTYWGLVREESTIKSILQQGDILVCPSYSEGMPTVILEAMATGMAIIATNVGAVDALVSQENGWLISPGSHDELMRAMEQAIHLSDNELQMKKKNSRSLVKNCYLWDRVAQQTISGIEATIGETKLSI